MSFVCVGAGVVGLTTALELQKNFPNARVSVIADKFGVDTTSDVAAGIFRPGPSFSGPTDEITRQWMNDSYEYWDDLRRKEDASLAGVTQLSVYCFSSTDPSIVRVRALFLFFLYPHFTTSENGLTNFENNNRI